MTRLNADAILHALTGAGADGASFLTPITRNHNGDGWVAELLFPNGAVPPHAEDRIATALDVETSTVRLTRINGLVVVRLEVADEAPAIEPTIPVLTPAGVEPVFDAGAFILDLDDGLLRVRLADGRWIESADDIWRPTDPDQIRAALRERADAEPPGIAVTRDAVDGRWKLALAYLFPGEVRP